jgi:hypothetical protein
MAVMLERWNDDRMDDLAGKVDEIGVQLREQRREAQAQGAELRRGMQAQGAELRREMQAQGAELRQEILELRRGIKRVRSRSPAQPSSVSPRCWPRSYRSPTVTTGGRLQRLPWPTTSVYHDNKLHFCDPRVTP